MNNPLDGSWFPSCVVKLTIRYDESLQVTTSDRRVTTKAIAATSKESRAAAGRRPRRELEEQARRRDNAALAELDDVRRAGLASEFEVPGAGPIGNLAGESAGEPATNIEPLTLGTDGFTVIANRVPKRGTFTLPHPRSAGKFTLAFDFAEFPVDPRLIRAVGLEIHLGTVSADDYARGMAGERDRTGRPLSILKTTEDRINPVTGRRGPNRGTLLFYATADTWDVEHGDRGSEIMIEGRDIRGILIDGKPPPAQLAKINLQQPIHLVVQDILKTMGVDHDLRLTVMTDAAEWPGGVVPSPAEANGLTRVRLGSSGEGAGSTPSTGTKTSYWDLITNYCTIVGAMPQLVGSELWIRPNRRIFDVVLKRGRYATPFAGGEPRTVGRERIRVRRLVYGRDLKKLKFSRKFAGTVVPTVQCISFDDQAAGLQRMIFGQWPPADSDTAQAKGTDDVMRVPMWGIRSVDRLTEIARGIYEEIGRGETGGSAETNDLASLGGDNGDPDILRLRPLEPVEFVIDANALRTMSPLVSELGDAPPRSFSEEVDLLTQKIGDRAVARALVALARGAVRELLAYYQVTSVQFEWGTGIRAQFQFQNYIVPRHQVADDDTPRPPDLKQTRVEVVGAHRKAKALTVKVPRGTAVTPRTAVVDRQIPTQPGRRPRNIKPPQVTIGRATGSPVDE